MKILTVIWTVSLLSLACSNAAIAITISARSSAPPTSICGEEAIVRDSDHLQHVAGGLGLVVQSPPQLARGVDLATPAGLIQHSVLRGHDTWGADGNDFRGNMSLFVNREAEAGLMEVLTVGQGIF